MQTLNLRRTDVVKSTDTESGIPAIPESDHPGVFADIYQDVHNIAVWQRNLPASLQLEVRNLLASGKPLQISLAVTPQTCLAEMRKALQYVENTRGLTEDITRLVDLFCKLFDLRHAKLRLTTLDRVMCPRFHVDKVACRMVTTYLGSSTQWLPHQAVDRTKLGRGNNGLPDELSGVYRCARDIRQLTNGDVALLKGSLWEGGKHTGLVHRSPTPEPGETRLLLAIDFAASNQARCQNQNNAI